MTIKFLSADKVSKDLEKAIDLVSGYMMTELLELFEDLSFSGSISTKHIMDQYDIRRGSPFDHVLHDEDLAQRIIKRVEKDLYDQGYRVQLTYRRRRFNYEARIRTRMSKWTKRALAVVTTLMLVTSSTAMYKMYNNQSNVIMNKAPMSMSFYPEPNWNPPELIPEHSAVPQQMENNMPIVMMEGYDDVLTSM